MDSYRALALDALQLCFQNKHSLPDCPKVMSRSTRLVSTWSHPCCLEGVFVKFIELRLSFIDLIFVIESFLFDFVITLTWFDTHNGILSSR